MIPATCAVTEPELIAEALDLLRVSPGLDQARADVRRYAESATRELAVLLPTKARDALESPACSVRNRTA